MTALHKELLKRSRIEVCNKKLCTLSGQRSGKCPLTPDLINSRASGESRFGGHLKGVLLLYFDSFSIAINQGLSQVSKVVYWMVEGLIFGKEVITHILSKNDGTTFIALKPL